MLEAEYQNAPMSKVGDAPKKLYRLFLVFCVSVVAFSVYVKYTSSPQWNTFEDSKWEEIPNQGPMIGVGATPGQPIPSPTVHPLKKMGLETELQRRLKNATDHKTILVWISMFGVKENIKIDVEKCGSCEVTYDRSKIDDEETGAVVFHFDGIKSSNMPPPSERKPHHLHIFWDRESTSSLRVLRGMSLDFEDSYAFNATMTYRLDADFYDNYEYTLLADIVESNKLSVDEILALKTKTAVAVVSNCGGTAGAKKRMAMMKTIMQLGFALDGYGGCFRNGRRFASGKDRKSEEFHAAIAQYKFYFSFENSYHCKNYITEKFFNNALHSKAVPVVWGATKEDYLRVAPPGSFIFADDFSSLQSLVEYLQYLDKNDTAYKEYLRWVELKPSEMPQYERAHNWCAICRALHGINVDDVYNPKYNSSKPLRPLFTDGVARRTVPSLKNWFYGEDNPECFLRHYD